eukprot:m.348436 g.348436  ORF g.348436 m.348436 type:complete len:103 (-) comp55869_c0_seq2:207-515(-)
MPSEQHGVQPWPPCVPTSVAPSRPFSRRPSVFLTSSMMTSDFPAPAPPLLWLFLLSGTRSACSLSLPLGAARVDSGSESRAISASFRAQLRSGPKSMFPALR